MTAHDWFIEHRTEYAARALDAAEMSAFAEHLAGCDACRAAVERIESELRWLPMGVSPVTPRPGLQRRILDHAVGRAPGRFRKWSLPIGIAASLLTGFTGWQLGQQASRDPITSPIVSAPARDAGIDARLLALQDTVSIMRQAARVMQAKIMMHGQEGGMVIFDEPRTHRWNVVVHGLPAAPIDTGYQFWFICADGMVRGTRVSLDRSTPMLFTTGMPAPSCKVTGAALTMEPMQNADGPPQGKTLAHLML
ncbi:MAG: anti-sigma factor [Gemmatimonadaceae bacterium]|nr:anti-sigma factor [Gemmatimonadaceae bacterium]